jgi:hypothetical protein
MRTSCCRTTTTSRGKFGRARCGGVSTSYGLNRQFSVDDVSDVPPVRRDRDLVNLLNSGKGIERRSNAILRNRAAPERAQQ